MHGFPRAMYVGLPYQSHYVTQTTYILGYCMPATTSSSNRQWHITINVLCNLVTPLVDILYYISYIIVFI